MFFGIEVIPAECGEIAAASFFPEETERAPVFDKEEQEFIGFLDAVEAVLDEPAQVLFVLRRSFEVLVVPPNRFTEVGVMNRKGAPVSLSRQPAKLS